MNNITEKLFALRDDEYANFQIKLTPGITKDEVIGVRVPLLRGLAKELEKGEIEEFLDNLPHKYYDENMLHSVLLSKVKDYDDFIKRVNEFLPYVNNWAVCDILSNKYVTKHKDIFINEINKWIKSKEDYTIRFGVEMLMSFYLDDDFNPKYNDMVAAIKSDAYYVNMMCAWYFATALAKKWDDTICYLENKKLSTWVHNKTIRKAIESYRVTNDQKTYLKSLIEK